MNTFWSVWITVITLGTLCGIGALLYWVSKDKMGVEEGEDMGHEYDGIREINNPLPKWWSYMFWGTLVFALVYLALFPGLGNFKGLLGWQSSNQTVTNLEESRQAIADAQAAKQLNQYARELETADGEFGEIFRDLVYREGTDEYRDLVELSQDDQAMKTAQRLFLQNCSQCHGSTGRGQLSYPNLADKDWLYGGEPMSIKQTIMHGRIGNMPANISGLDEQGVDEIVSYVLSLSGRKVNSRDAEAGRQKFAACAACHGTDAKGNPAFGAPNLTDNTWLYGGNRAQVEETILYGRQGVMPAWSPILGEDKVHLLSAYVWKISNND
uniref:cytochrome-c oxidase, cbb3-type subunit III n=1 Tax=Thaumasiovibrio occultus TaxID=1891184 RepID=UPI000B3630A4|nr:cytochrome-c oxidase, cbb3-type subunit III [Thaumasiovibrio occultus]